MKSIKTVLAIVGLVSSLFSHAGIIETDSQYGGAQVNAHEPIAQSFTATDSAIKFAFYYYGMNVWAANDPLRITLVSGNGLGGPTLAMRDFSLASDFNGFFDIDFSALSLLIGQSYTATLMVLSDSPFWGVGLSSMDYLGGVGYSHANVLLAKDWGFRVTTVSQSNQVPEPTTIALLGLGLLGFAASRRKSARRKNA